MLFAAGSNVFCFTRARYIQLSLFCISPTVFSVACLSFNLNVPNFDAVDRERLKGKLQTVIEQSNSNQILLKSVPAKLHTVSLLLSSDIIPVLETDVFVTVCVSFVSGDY